MIVSPYPTTQTSISRPAPMPMIMKFNQAGFCTHLNIFLPFCYEKNFNQAVSQGQFDRCQGLNAYCCFKHKRPGVSVPVADHDQVRICAGEPTAEYSLSVVFLFNDHGRDRQVDLLSAQYMSR